MQCKEESSGLDVCSTKCLRVALCSLLMTSWTQNHQPWKFQGCYGAESGLGLGRARWWRKGVHAAFFTVDDYSNRSTTKKWQNISCYQSQSSRPVGLGSVCISLLSEDPGNLSRLGNSSQLLAAPKWGAGRGWWLCACQRFVRGTEIHVRRNRTVLYHSFNGRPLFLAFSLPFC